MATVSRGVFGWLFRPPAVLEDFGDRINHFWTFALLLMLASIVSWKQGYNEPISCWTPSNFTTVQNNYVHDVCWNSHIIQYPKSYESNYAGDKLYSQEGTPSTPVDYPLVMEKRSTMNEYFPYTQSATRTVYQWLPLLLCLQALCFKLPCIVMYLLHGLSGLTFEKISSFTRGFENMNMQDRSDLSKCAAQFILDWCVKLNCPLPWRQLSAVWLFVKILYVVNIILQLVFFDATLRTNNVNNINSTTYTGIISGNIFNNNVTTWRESSAFPRVVYCLFDINELRDMRKYHVQCHLQVNAFNEQVCMFVWVWFHFVAVTTILSIIIWLVRVVRQTVRNRYITEALYRTVYIKERDVRYDDEKAFCQIIGEDGVMVLKLISANSSESLIGEIVADMWILKRDRDSEAFERGAEKLSRMYAAKQRSSDWPTIGSTEIPEPETETNI